MAGLTGGFGNEELATPEVQEMCNKIKPDVENKLGQNFVEFVAMVYRKQVVNGINWMIKVRVGSDVCIHLKIYQTFNGDLSLSGYQTSKTADEPLVVF